MDFGAYGQNLPGDGEMYCGPTSILMGLYYLSANGFTQLAPAVYGGQEDAAATSLERVVAGLMGCTATGGTSGEGLMQGVASYLSACGIAPEQYQVSDSGSPDLAFVMEMIAPNVSQDPSGPIALTCFSVGWFWRDDVTSTDFSGGGGHVLAPLVSELILLPLPPLPPGVPTEMLILNNAYPASFEAVPNLPTENPQMVQIAPVPSGWSLPGMDLPSQDYSQVLSGTQGGEDVAILWGAAAWTIAATARPDSPGYQPSPWVLTEQVMLNTNGGSLTVVAPLWGGGGVHKVGDGILLLTAANGTTGRNLVTGGTLASNQTEGTPFGSGTMVLANGGTLQLSGTGTQSVTIAGGNGGASSLFSLGDAGGTLAITSTDAFTVCLGGHEDGIHPNLTSIPGATLILAPGGGISALGATQRIIVSGSAGNLPPVAGGMVTPCIIGLDSDGQSGRFLTYDATNGFVLAAMTSSADVTIDQVPSDAIYRVVTEQTVAPGATAQAAALEVDGVHLYGGSGTLLVGDQTSGSAAGLILNNVPNILVGNLGFGAATAFLYAGGESKISATLTGSAGLTSFGPGTLTLWADSAQTLSGPVTVNSGTLIASGATQAGASATGSGNVTINSGATLEVSGAVAGAVTVAVGGTLLLNGGSIAGTVTQISDASTYPGGVIQGGGTIEGFATLHGAITSGPAAGILIFKAGIATSASTCFWWRLQSLVDKSTGNAGVDWNAIEVYGGGASFGKRGVGVTYYLDFSALAGDPDAGDPFWQSPHVWPIVLTNVACYDNWGNFTYQSGTFDMDFEDDQFCLTWTPASSRQSPAQQRRTRAAAARARSEQLGSA
ncbi:hypothetical protein [Azorhizobium sp. AG788]|uniref:hypothetical protein n=1 Tax=Azorhizobium sp. AG788 TaxID=2183897 RepID=UPI00313874A4